jgi:hypothetical protein
MPSQALTRWQTARAGRLGALDAECVAAAGRRPPDPVVEDVLVRGFVLLLGAEFQGFCRDLYAECGLAVVNAVPVALQVVVQVQCQAKSELTTGNAKFESIRSDFERFDLTLTPALRGHDPATDAHLTALGHLNAWRNYVAHDKPTPPAHGGPLAGCLRPVRREPGRRPVSSPGGAARHRPMVTWRHAMAWETDGTAFKVGDRVRLRPPSSQRAGRVVEDVGPLGGGGAEAYRVKLRGGRHPAYIVVRFDQIEPAPKPAPQP